MSFLEVFQDLEVFNREALLALLLGRRLDVKRMQAFDLVHGVHDGNGGAGGRTGLL